MQNLTMVLPSRLGCPLSLKTPNMGNTGLGIQGRGVTIQQYLTVQGDVLGDLDAERKIKGLAAEGVMEAIIDGKFSGTSIRLGG